MQNRQGFGLVFICEKEERAVVTIPLKWSKNYKIFLRLLYTYYEYLDEISLILGIDCISFTGL
jgi:hypothetical protein